MNIYFKSKAFDGQSLAFIPGPENVDWIEDSQSIEFFEDYSPFAVKNGFLAHPNISFEGIVDEINTWRFRWSGGDRFICLNMTTFDGTNDSSWGGSNLIETNCLYSDILSLWLAIREKFPAIWLHDEDCNVYSGRAFVADFALPRMGKLKDTFKNSREARFERALLERLSQPFDSAL